MLPFFVWISSCWWFSSHILQHGVSLPFCLDWLPPPQNSLPCALNRHAFLGHTWATEKLETLLSTLELQAWMMLLMAAWHAHAVQEIKGITLAVAAPPGNGSAVYQFVLKSQSQDCLYSVFLPPPWVDSTLQKAVNIMIYQTAECLGPILDSQRFFMLRKTARWLLH